MAEEVVRYVDIRPLVNDVDNIKKDISLLNNKINDVSESIAKASEELESLNRQFMELMEDRVRAEALSQATTELVRVRQEIEKEFGSYGLVRETMLGVLQATDLALVKKTTISTVSEELMISTPKYWLSPCLIAVSAWINNDRDLAERAIKEALKRDEERTALTMALICRRNGRTDACYEWLNIYFSHLNAGNFSEGGYTFVDAYINGVFGSDEKHICSDYIARWLSQIKEDDKEFEVKQEKQWKDYCVLKTNSYSGMYPTLKDYSPEFDNIMAYTDRVYSVDNLIKEFDGMRNADVEIEKIKKRVDENLVEVISNYAVEEIKLRDDEICFQRVKESNGKIKYNEVKQALLQQRANKQQEKINFVEQMMKAITDKKNSSPSERRTAISILHPYINKGYNEYINEKKALFPDEININVNGYNMKANTNSDVNALKQGYRNYLLQRKNEEIRNFTGGAEKKNAIAAIALLILGIFTLTFVIGFAFLAGAAYFGYKWYKIKNEPEKYLGDINLRFDNELNSGFQIIDNCVGEWQNINNKVNEFDNKQKYLVA
jgi:hypothetical protein